MSYSKLRDTKEFKSALAMLPRYDTFKNTLSGIINKNDTDLKSFVLGCHHSDRWTKEEEEIFLKRPEMFSSPSIREGYYEGGILCLYKKDDIDFLNF